MSITGWGGKLWVVNLAESSLPHIEFVGKILKGFVEEVHNDLFVYLRVAQLWAFHLEIAVKGFERTIKEMEWATGSRRQRDFFLGGVDCLVTKRVIL